MESGKEVAYLRGPRGPNAAAAATPSGDYLVAGGADMKVRLYEVATGDPLREFPAPTRIYCVALTPDGRHALGGGGTVQMQDGKPVKQGGQLLFTDCHVRVWDAQTGKEVCRFEGHEHIPQRVIVSPDGRRALSGSSDGRVFLWDVLTGREVRRFELGRVGVQSLAFSPDGR